MSKNFRSLGRGRMPSGLAVSGKGSRSAAEIAVGVGAGVVVGGGALYAYDRYTNKDEEAEKPASFVSEVEEYERNDQAIEEKEKELKELRKGLDRSARAVEHAKTKTRKPETK